MVLVLALRSPGILFRLDTYGERPKNWLGGEAVRFVPKTGEPAWQRWQIENRQEIDYLLTPAKAHKLIINSQSTMPVWRNGRRTGLKITPIALLLCRIKFHQSSEKHCEHWSKTCFSPILKGGRFSG